MPQSQVELLCKITTGLCLSTVSATTQAMAGNMKKAAAPNTAQYALIDTTCFTCTCISYESNADVKFTGNILGGAKKMAQPLVEYNFTITQAYSTRFSRHVFNHM